MMSPLLKRCATALGFLCVSVIAAPMAANAQQNNPFHLPAELPVPSWVKLTDWNNPNVYRIDSLIEVYKSTGERKVKDVREAEQEGEDEFSEDPYLNAYVRWRTQMSAFVQADGSVKYDPEYARKELIRSIEAQQTKAPAGTARKTTAVANWTVLGPSQTYNVGTGALKNYQSNIYCIAIAPSNPSVLYAGSEPGTFFRSADKGLHWTSVSSSLVTCGSKSIAVDPLNENIVYTYDGTANALLKTTTGGGTWSVLTGFTGGTGNAIVINRNTGRILITGTTSIYYSDNGGTTWTMATGSTVTGILYDMVLNPVGTDTVYAVGSSASNLVMLRSVNGGTTFTDVTGATIAATGTAGARLAVSPAGTNYVYCVNLGSSTPPRIIRSTDRGNSWAVTATSTTTGLTGGSGTTGLAMSNGQGYYDLSIMVSPSNVNHVIVGTTTTYKSTDGGVNFGPLGGYAGTFGLHPDIQQAVVLGSDAYIATDGGVNYSTDFFTNTANWSVRNNGIHSADYWGFGQGWDEDIVVGGRYHNGDAAIYDVYGGGKALALGGGEDATGHVYHGFSRTAGFRDIGNVILPATLSGAAQYSAANVPNSLWPQDNYYGEFSSKLVTDPRYSNIFYLGKDSILWKSSNRGFSYQSLHNFGNGNKVWRFDIARSDPSVMYVCANNGVYKTTDAGTTWTTITLPVAWSNYNSDIVVNPLNANEVYLCMANAGAANKVFRTTNGGTTWTNITGTALNGKKVAFLQFHAGTASGVYAITNSRPSKVFYKDTTMADWTTYSDGLPEGLQAREGGLIFFRDNKMRLAGNSSIWETPLYTTGAPVAQPMADKQFVGCARDTVNFFDYSMYNYAGATRTWSFPGALWVSSYTALRPQVVYPGAGTYSVSLSVTNALSQTHIRSIPNMITVSDDNCKPDTVAGKCLQLNGTSQTVNLGVANINSNNFSISCWIQPSGKQSSFSQIVGHAAYPGSNGYGFGMGFKFNGYTPNLILCYTDSTVNYSGTSNLVCDSTKWNYVVLTYSPARVVMYLNGVGDTINNGPMPVIDLSQAPFQINYDVHNGQGSKFKGKIEEVKFFDHALTQEEVREKMHLITDPATETDLLKYFQFNQYDLTSGSLYDVKGNFNSFVPSANIVTSTAPVSSGRMVRLPLVATGGLQSFGAADVNMHLPASGTYPDGEVVAFHLLSGPDTKPDTRPAVPGYFIINNYGSNKVFTRPDSMVFSRLNIPYPGYTAGDFRLFARGTGDFGNTWSAQLDSAARFVYATTGSKLTWKNNVYDTVFSRQYIMINNDTTSFVGTPAVQAADRCVVSELYPNPTREWTRMNIYVPNVPVGAASCTITDARGVQVISFNERLSQGNNTLMIHLPEVAPGMYLINLSIPGQQVYTRKLLID